jgi:3',5'-cyclic-AMP phosphodiesterase
LRATLVLSLLLLSAALAVWPSPSGFRFVVLGDRTGDANQAIYEQVWKDVESEHPDFVLNVGDTIQGWNDATAQAEWDRLQLFWNLRPNLRQYFTPGNHDIWSEASREIYERAVKHPAAYGFDFQDAHFTVLDNSGSLDLSEPQMQFLEADLQRNRAKNPKFVSFHQPFWLIPLKFQSGEFPFHQLVKKYGVNAVFSGHGHQFVRLERDGIVYLEAGSSGAKLKGQGFAQGWFFGNTVVDVSPASLRLTLRETGPPFGESRIFETR